MKISANKEKLQRVLDEWNNYHTQWIITNELQGSRFNNYTLKATNNNNIICDFELELLLELRKLGNLIIVTDNGNIIIDLTIKVEE